MSGGVGGNRILLVQDDPKQTELYSELIHGVADCEVDVVAHPETSLQWIARTNYHLVVIDAQAGTSRENQPLVLLSTIKRISPSTSVVILSENGSVEEAVAAIRTGAEDYLKKPFNLEAFQLAVKRGLDRKLLFGQDDGASSYLNLVNCCQMISASLEQNRILGIVQSYIMRELHCDHAAIWRVVEGAPVRVETETEAHPPIKRDRTIDEVMSISLQANNPLPRMSETAELFRFIDRGQLTPGLFIFRFRCVGEEEFFLVCLSPERPVSPEAFESRLKLLRAQIEVTGKNIKQYLGVQHLVYVDDATGLYNTRYLYNILEREVAQYATTKKSFAILFLDGDRFKSINDTYGHLAGTKLLNELGAQLKTFVRDKDTVFRYGGDEFVAVLTNCDLPTAQRVAERIRSSIEKRVFLESEGKNIKITVSIGVALFPDHADSIKSVINAADHAMYSAKKGTRNSVFIAPLPLGKEPGAKSFGRADEILHVSADVAQASPSHSVVAISSKEQIVESRRKKTKG